MQIAVKSGGPLAPVYLHICAIAIDVALTNVSIDFLFILVSIK